MFSPGTKRSSRRGVTPAQAGLHSPTTPAHYQHSSTLIPNRPSTGTPAPWAPRLSVLARILPANKAENASQADPIKPVFVEEFPQLVRDEQTSLLHNRVPGDAHVCGGMDKETCLSWIICRNKLFVWSYLSSVSSSRRNCVVLELPPGVLNDGGSGSWIVCVVNWEGGVRRRRNEVARGCSSAGVVMCNRKTGAVVYWADIYGEVTCVTSVLASDESDVGSLPAGMSTISNRQRQQKHGRVANCLVGLNSFVSLIACPVDASRRVCLALACSCNGELWQLHCHTSEIQRSKVYEDMVSFSASQRSESGQFVGNKGYPRSLVWRFPFHSVEQSNRQFFLLTEHEIQCFSVKFQPDVSVSKLWSHEIVGTDNELGIKKDLAGQKRIWPLDMQVDDHGKVISVLIATFCKDRVSSSSYTQYSLLTMQYKSSNSMPSETNERLLEKKAPLQVIIPKARVEDEGFLFSMRLRVGGKPSGSAIILSGDGTATVSHYYSNSTRLYQFDLPYDAGKVLDASILPSADDIEDGAWVVLTEKAGIWAIPEKAVVLGGVEPPERSLSRKGSSNEGSVQEEKRNLTFGGNIAARRASSEAWDSGDRQRAIMTGVARPSALDEESEALLGQLFHDFLLTGQVNASFEKLQSSGSFDRDGETNVFTRLSKSIVDTLAKHWTTTRGAEIVAMAIVSSQLIDKQQKHEQYLQFLALSKCHEELCSKQRQALQAILEHGEKLAGMIQLRELQNIISHNRSSASGSPQPSPDFQISGALLDLIQLVGETARRNTVLLMDRDNAEVFYTKVSELEQVFDCLGRHLEYILSEEQPPDIQIQRACEISNALVSVVHTAMQYRTEHHMWYPPPEGLTPWFCQPVVRNGLWRVASFMLQLVDEVSGLDLSPRSDLFTHLELLTEILLEAYAGAITAKLDCGEGHKGLLDEYWNRRDALLDSLYKQVRHFVEGRHQIFNVGSEEPNTETLRKLSLNLLSIAKRHEGYNTMWRIFCDLNDFELLRHLMNESMGPKGGFSYFVFKELYAKKQFSKLLRLGEEFQEELCIFLKDHPDLLWLHELFLHQFASASETLHRLALSQNGHLGPEAEEGVDPEPSSMAMMLSDRKHLLNLSKIAAMAGKDTDYETDVKRIEADLKILKLQEAIVGVLGANEAMQDDGQRLLRPEDLIELCIKADNPEQALWAFDVFAWTSSSFCRSNRRLLEECWKNAADQDDWGQLHQAYTDEGWSDEEMLQQLRNTVLFQASSRCYGPEAETIEGGFDEVLPLRTENLDLTGLKDFDISVESILMQHKDFPDAGKLMLTAIMLGSVHDDTKAQEGPSPME